VGFLLAVPRGLEYGRFWYVDCEESRDFSVGVKKGYSGARVEEGEVKWCLVIGGKAYEWAGEGGELTATFE